MNKAITTRFFPSFCFASGGWCSLMPRHRGHFGSTHPVSGHAKIGEPSRRNAAEMRRSAVLTTITSCSSCVVVNVEAVMLTLARQNFVGHREVG